MQRWCSKLRLLGALHSAAKPPQISFSITVPRRTLQISCNLFHKSVSPTAIFPKSESPPNAPQISYPSISSRSSLLPPTFMQVRHITAKQRKRKLKSRKPMTPVTSKVKKIKMKYYSSFKGRFRVMNDGQIRRWKEGKRHNAHSKVEELVTECKKKGLEKANSSFLNKEVLYFNLIKEKSKKAKRRLRRPGTVPLAYAKVMKKLNFCG